MTTTFVTIYTDVMNRMGWPVTDTTLLTRAKRVINQINRVAATNYEKHAVGIANLLKAELAERDDEVAPRRPHRRAVSPAAAVDVARLDGGSGGVRTGSF